MPRKFFTLIERNSNSWHVTRICEQSHFVEDDQVIDYVRIVIEWDVALGNIEPVIEEYGIDSLIDAETLQMMLHTFPKPKYIP